MKDLLQTIKKLQDNNANLLKQIRESQVNQYIDIGFYNASEYDKEFIEKHKQIIEINAILINLFKYNDDHIQRLLDLLTTATSQ